MMTMAQLRSTSCQHFILFDHKEDSVGAGIVNLRLERQADPAGEDVFVGSPDQVELAPDLLPQ